MSIMKKAIAITMIIGGSVALLACVALLVGAPTASVPAGPAVAATTPVAAAAGAATPDPKGRYQGSCDYTLTPNIYGNDHLIGEIDLTNTGNIGTIDHVRITWPQEGYAPIAKTRNVKTNPGEHLAVRFHIPVPSTGNVITLLQSWQERHNFKEGCTYKTAITGMFGPVS